MKPDSFIKLAIRTAYSSSSKFRLGAVLTKRNHVISTACNNMNKTHPVQAKASKLPFSIGIHAEVRSCIGIPLCDLENSNLYVARVLRNGNLGISKPCSSCERFIREVGIKKVFFTTDTSEIGEMSVN